MERPAAVDRLAAMLIEKESRATSVARLLHDNAGQTLSAIGFHLQALRADPATTAEIQGYLEEVIENVRLACNKLQSNVVERSGLPLAVEMLASRLREESGFQVALKTESNRRFPASVGHAAYRVIELALENVRKHAGVDTASVYLLTDDTGLAVTIEDRGRGFDAERARQDAPGSGLILMEAYAASGNLQLDISSAPGTGTIIKIKTN